MKPKISIVTLGVRDYQKSLMFYRDGLKLPVAKGSTNDITFFELEGTWLAIFPREKAAEYIGIYDDGKGFPGFTIAHNEPSKEKVDKTMQLALEAGAEIVKMPQDVFWGSNSLGDCLKRLSAVCQTATT